MLPLSSILDHVLGRKYLSLFLETLASQGLVGYWTAVEELRAAHRSNWHQLGAEIFYTYIRTPSTEIKVDKNTRKRMEAFLLGNVAKVQRRTYISLFINNFQETKDQKYFTKYNKM